MPKSLTLFRCTECAYETPKWAGKCPNCESWSTLQEVQKSTPLPGRKISISGRAKSLQRIEKGTLFGNERIFSGIHELDRVLGGGMMPDSLVLLTGDPGIGKSTLTLQWALQIARKYPNEKIMIISAEESVPQISARAQRLGNVPENVFLLSEFLLENILATVEAESPKFLILDSVQTIASGEVPSAPGSISQIRTVTERIMHFIKQAKIPTVLIGHVTKSGDMAGPQVLAHLVDTVLYLEGDQFHQFRLLRSTKNRFGSVFEVGIFEMREEGLMEVANPSEALLSGRLENAVGSIIFPTIEGTRPFLIEVQALTSATNFGYPKRTATGIDLNRLNLILAILQRHADIKLDTSDVFGNVVGGFKVREPALDLPLALALASSKLKKAIPTKMIALGELGLSGEIRAISHLEKRLNEAEKLGFASAVVGRDAMNRVSTKTTKLEIISGKTIGEVIQKVF
ncbi:DNA repair protein RadA [Candidatus Peregrinibacteria bacterium]|nr:DNA repair protein RadA [Candidatus Peregrinibacteria bacterium]